jgi:hypothetical protein
VKLFAGTSGFSYDGWAGTFYPEDLPAAGRLAFYAAKLPAVEINNTFYRMPKPELLAGWAAQVPAGFRFALKASQRITHIKRLKEVDGEVKFLLGAARQLGDKLGPVLYGLPPNLKKDVRRRPLHRRRRERRDPVRGDGAVGVPEAPARGLRRGRARRVGAEGEGRRLGRGVRLLQARGGGRRARPRRALYGALLRRDRVREKELADKR